MSKSFTGIINPSWDEIERVRDITCRFLKENKMKDDVIDAIIMVIGELLENAIKYGHYKQDKETIPYSIMLNTKTITVEVKNPVDENDDENLKKLDRMIQWIRGYQNPFESYVEKLREVSARPLDDISSGLGLTRIAYEGQAILDFYALDNGTISVSAVYQI